MALRNNALTKDEHSAPRGLNLRPSHSGVDSVTRLSGELNPRAFSDGMDALTVGHACLATNTSQCEIGAIARTDRLNG